MLSLSEDKDELVKIGYILYMNNKNKCINNIPIDSILYICREKNHLIAVIDEEDVFIDTLKCIRAGERTFSKNSPRIICLYTIDELSEKLGCITDS